MAPTASPIALPGTAPTSAPSLIGALIGGKPATLQGGDLSEDVAGAAAGGGGSTAKTTTTGGGDAFAQALAALLGQATPQPPVALTTSLPPASTAAAPSAGVPGQSFAELASAAGSGSIKAGAPVVAPTLPASFIAAALGSASTGTVTTEIAQGGAPQDPTSAKAAAATPASLIETVAEATEFPATGSAPAATAAEPALSASPEILSATVNFVANDQAAPTKFEPAVSSPAPAPSGALQPADAQSTLATPIATLPAAQLAASLAPAETPLDDQDAPADAVVGADVASPAGSTAQAGLFAKPFTAAKTTTKGGDPAQAASSDDSAAGIGEDAPAAASDPLAPLARLIGQDGSSGSSSKGADDSTADLPNVASSADTASLQSAALIPTASGGAGNVAGTSASATGGGAGAAIVGQIADQIAAKTTAKSTRFDVSLDPAGLGRVDVQVHIDSAGQVSASLSFTNAQSAADARSHAADLQRALEQAGFNVSQGGLSFDVGGQGASLAQQQHGSQGRASPGAAAAAFANTNPDSAVQSSVGQRASFGASGLDITI